MNLFKFLSDVFVANKIKRPPDFIIGDKEKPYLYRWYVIPRNRFFNIYLHRIMRSDDDRALHDHPWSNASLILRGCYVEHTIAAGGIHNRWVFMAGDFRIRWLGSMAHRLEILNGDCWTLFVTGPRYRRWGFHCPDAGWIDYEKFTNPNNYGEVGKGCDQ